MLKYYFAAAGLKGFSLNDTTVRAYRQLGNLIGGKRRSGTVRSGYFQRSDQNLRFLEESGVVADGVMALELGTGWIHWEALFTSIFYDVKFTLFDVWDNRQFHGFIHYAKELRHRLRHELNRPERQLSRAEGVLDSVLQCETFDEVYHLLGWSYLLDWDGKLDAVPDETLDLIISSDVLEHVHRASFRDLAEAHGRILKASGFVAHQVVFTDHITIYDNSMHTKNYLRMSDALWRLIGENRVQYINRFQPSEIEQFFADAGLQLVKAQRTGVCEIDSIKIARQFGGFSREDLETTVKNILFRKNPAGTSSAQI